MSSKAAPFLDKARKLLRDAAIMLDGGLNDAAGRTAYLAGYHAAQAFIAGKNGKVAKTHSGVQTEFARLAKDDLRLAPELRTFLSRSYNLNALADYETGPGSEVSRERAIEAIQTGTRFVEWVAVYPEKKRE